MKTEHKIYAALAVLALLALGVYMTNQSKNEQAAQHTKTSSSADMPSVSVPKDDVEKITKIEVTSPNKDDKTKRSTITLEKKGDAWELMAPVAAKANAANVRSLLDNLKELKIKESIDRTTGSYPQYELSDEKSVHVTAWKGADKAIDLYFGKSGGRGQLARIGGKDGVWAAAGYQSYLYTREVKNWRETGILKFEDANAIQVEVTNKNGLLSFSKNGDKWSASLTKRDKDGALEKKPEKEWKKFEEAKVKDLLRAFKGLNADDFGEAKDKADAGLDKAEENGGVVHIKLKDNAGDLVIKVGKVSKGTNRWAIKEGGDGTLYSLSAWSADWATAAASKFEKSEDGKGDKDKKDKAPPPSLDDMPGDD